MGKDVPICLSVSSQGFGDNLFASECSIMISHNTLGMPLRKDVNYRIRSARNHSTRYSFSNITRILNARYLIQYLDDFRSPGIFQLRSAMFAFLSKLDSILITIEATIDEPSLNTLGSVSQVYPTLAEN